jgi:hypothetical protein
VSTGDWLSLAGLIVAVVGVPTAVLATRRWGTRRARLQFGWDVTPLLLVARLDEHDQIKITYRGRPVDNPHLLTVRLANVGPVDITRAHFDGGENVAVKLNCVMYGLTKTTHPDHTDTTVAGRAGQILLTPLLLKRSEEWIIEAIVSGWPQPELHCPLTDTDVTHGKADNFDGFLGSLRFQVKGTLFGPEAVGGYLTLD